MFQAIEVLVKKYACAVRQEVKGMNRSMFEDLARLCTPAGISIRWIMSRPLPGEARAPFDETDTLIYEAIGNRVELPPTKSTH